MALECKCISEEDKTIIMGSLIKMRNIENKDLKSFKEIAERSEWVKKLHLYEPILEMHKNRILKLNKLHSEISNIKTCK